MTTAIDSNILIDLIGRRTDYTADSIHCLDVVRMAGALVICPVVVAEISIYFETPETLARMLLEMQITVVESSLRDAHRAGSAYVKYKRKSSQPKDRMLADFLVASHALHHGGRLLTRDRGYYRTFFPELKLIEPGRVG